MSGHNPKMNSQSDDLQNVAALLRSLPQVAAPTNFDAMLKARIAQAKLEQKTDVTALLQELPRIAAPSDFDFKLRARIAQAQSKEEKTSPLGWFSEVFGRTFSWAQTGAAMATVALIVGVMTFQMAKTGASNPTSTAVASASQTPKNNITEEASTALLTSVATAQPREIKSAPTASYTNNLAGARSVKARYTSVKDPRPKPNPIENVVPIPEIREQDLVAANTVLIKHSSGETRVVKVAEVSFGLQSANLRSNSPRGDQANLEIASAQIY